MKRLFTLLGATLLLSAALCVSASASDYDAVAEDLADIGMFRGTASGFELDRAPTRSEAAIMLVRLYGAEEEAAAAYEAGELTLPFTDVGATAAPYVAWLYENGIVNGTSATTYGAASACTAQNYVVFLLRALGYQDGQDFAYADALTFAQEKGFYNPLMFPGEFLRDDLAAVTYQALATDRKDGEAYLLESLIDSGAIDAQAAAPMVEKIEAYRALLAASAEMDGSASLDADVEADITAAYTGETSESLALSMAGSMQVLLDESDMQMAYVFDIDAMGETMTMGEWMRDGWVYMEMEADGETVQTKTQVDTAEMQALLDQVQSTAAMASPAVSADGLAMVDSIDVSASGGKTVYTLVISQSSIGTVMEAALGMLDTELSDADAILLGGLLATMNFSDITAAYTVGSDGQVEDMAIQFSMTLDGTALGAPEESLTMAFDMDVAINALGEDVTVEFPAGLEDFPELPELPDELPADVETTGEVSVPSASDPSESTDPSAEETARTIYVTKTGKRYHYDSTCNGGTYYPSTLEEALSRGLTPCEKCVL